MLKVALFCTWQMSCTWQKFWVHIFDQYTKKNFEFWSIERLVLYIILTKSPIYIAVKTIELKLWRRISQLWCVHFLYILLPIELKWSSFITCIVQDDVALAKYKAIKMRNRILSRTGHQWNYNSLLYFVVIYVNIFRNSDSLNISNNIIFLKVLYSKLPHFCSMNVAWVG